MKSHQNQWQHLVISEFYQSSKIKFFRFISKNYLLNDFEVEDIFHEAIFILIQNLKSKKPIERTCSPETFLFGIGKNLSRMLKRKQLKERNIQMSKIINLETIDEEKWDARFRKAEKFINQEQYRILRLFYLKGLSSEEIMHRMKYKNQNTVKTIKYKKLKKLKKVMETA